MEIARITSGKYSIGSNSIPNASPKHHREFRVTWLDRCLVTLGHYERFVAGSGYHTPSLWPHSADYHPPYSVDQRCSELKQQSLAVAALFRERPRLSSEIPLVGVTWMEADAIARFAGGRLPFESEWEVAMKRSEKNVTDAHDRRSIPSCWRSAPLSDIGCVVATNTLQEWTADPFSQRYWRADSSEHGRYWTAADAYGISLRGSSKSDMHKDYRFRRAADPKEIHLARGFRRAWESEPTAHQVSSSFIQ